MKEMRVSHQEGGLLDTISQNRELVWRRYQRRYPDLWINGQSIRADHSSYPPYVAFRFKDADENFERKLIFAVRSYSGLIPWDIKGHPRDNLPGVNWIIAPKKVLVLDDEIRGDGVASDEYFSKFDPTFGPVAYEDMKNLNSYVAHCLREL